MGVINIGTSYGLSYSDFEQWQEDVATMRIHFYTTSDYSELEQLINQSNTQLGSFWECPDTPDNIVKSIEIYW